MQEFIDSGIVAAVKAAKRTGNAELRSCAESQLETWKRKSQAAKSDIVASNNNDVKFTPAAALVKTVSSSALTGLNPANPISAGIS
jgi:hypothetical protein